MRALIAVALIVVGADAAVADVSVAITAPTAGSRRASPIGISVTVTSPLAVATVRAQVGAATTNLAVSTPTTWTGTLAVPALPFGDATLVVTATDVEGTAGTAMVVFVHDEPPVVTITSPQPGAVARPMLPVIATCTDDDPVNGCLAFSASAGGGGGSLSGVPIDGVLDLAALDGTADTITFRARDSSGNTYLTTRPIFVEGSADLTDVVSLGRRVLDVDATRVLYVGTDFVVRIQPRAGGAESVIAPIGEQGTSPPHGRLTSTGAVWVSMLGPGPGCPAGRQETLEWRGAGAPVSLGVACPGQQPSPWIIAGDWAWHLEADGTVVRRDLAIGLATIVTFPPDVGGPVSDPFRLARNGDLLRLVRADGEVRFVRDRQGVQVELGRGTAGPQPAPVFDGLVVAYLHPGAPAGRAALIRAGQPPLVLGDPLDPQFAGQSHEVGGGHVAFTRASMTTGARQIWRRAPDGAESNLTPFAADSVIDTMAPDGQLTVITGGQTRYLADPGGPPLRVGSELGRAVFLADGLHVVVGRTVLRHGEGALAVDAGVDAPPPPDAAPDAAVAPPADAALADAGAGAGGPTEGCGGCAGGGDARGAVVLLLLALALAGNRRTVRARR